MKKLYRQILSGVLMVVLFHAQAQIFQPSRSSDAYLNFDPDVIKIIDLNQDGIEWYLDGTLISTTGGGVYPFICVAKTLTSLKLSSN